MAAYSLPNPPREEASLLRRVLLCPQINARLDATAIRGVKYSERQPSALCKTRSDFQLPDAHPGPIWPSSVHH